MPVFAFNKYQPPGVYIDETVGPVGAPVSIAPSILALVGDTLRNRSYTEAIQLNGTTPVQLTQLGISTSTISVKDRFTGVTYALTTDYTVASQAGADAVLSTSDDTTTITRAGSGGITTGTYVTVTYSYTDPNYYKPFHFSSYDDVRTLYGDPFDSSGTIQSPLTLAAFLAFANGASEVVGLAVQAAGSTPSSGEWTSAIALLSEDPTITAIVPVSGDTAVHAAVRNHCIQNESLNQFRIGIVGRDGTTTAVTAGDLRSQASGYADSRMVIVAPTVFDFYNGIGVIKLGGHYAAAATGGLFASQATQVPITNKAISGFWDIPTQLTRREINDTLAAGVTVLYQRRDNRIVVQHGLTTNMANDYTREISVVAAKNALHTLLQVSLEQSNLIGSPITELTGDVVSSSVLHTLELAKGQGLILDYNGLSWRQRSDSPTTFEVKFQYLPTLPLNYLHVTFAIDTNVGSVTFTDVTTSNATI